MGTQGLRASRLARAVPYHAGPWAQCLGAWHFPASQHPHATALRPQAQKFLSGLPGTAPPRHAPHAGATRTYPILRIHRTGGTHHPTVVNVPLPHGPPFKGTYESEREAYVWAWA